MKVLRLLHETYIWHGAVSFRLSLIDRYNSPLWHLTQAERWVYMALCIAAVENPQIPYNEDYIVWRTKTPKATVRRALKKIILYKLADIDEVPDIDAGIDTSNQTLTQRKIYALCRRHPLRDDIWKAFLQWWHTYPHPPRSLHVQAQEIKLKPNFFVFLKFSTIFRTTCKLKSFFRAAANYGEKQIAPHKRMSARKFLTKKWKEYRYTKHNS